MEKTWLQDFVGQRISAVTGHHEDKSEAGELIAMGDGWLQLEKDNGELLLIPFTAIRIIKLLDMTRNNSCHQRSIAIIHAVISSSNRRAEQFAFGILSLHHNFR